MGEAVRDLPAIATRRKIQRHHLIAPQGAPIQHMGSAARARGAQMGNQQIMRLARCSAGALKTAAISCPRNAHRLAFAAQLAQRRAHPRARAALCQLSGKSEAMRIAWARNRLGLQRACAATREPHDLLITHLRAPRTCSAAHVLDGRALRRYQVMALDFAPSDDGWQVTHRLAHRRQRLWTGDIVLDDASDDAPDDAAERKGR